MLPFGRMPSAAPRSFEDTAALVLFMWAVPNYVWDLGFGYLCGNIAAETIIQTHRAVPQTQTL